MKRNILFIATLFCMLFVLNSVVIHAVLEDTQENLDKNVENLENTKTNIETKWDYLGREWQNILLKNKIVSGLDNFLKKISIVFETLFAEPYNLSLTLFLIVVIWIFFFFKIREVIMDYFSLSSGISSIIGFGGVIALAQIKILKEIVTFLGFITFSTEASWLRFIFVIIIVLFLFLFYKISSLFGDAYKKSIEQLEKEQEKLDRKSLRFIVNAFVKGLKK